MKKGNLILLCSEESDCYQFCKWMSRGVPFLARAFFVRFLGSSFGAKANDLISRPGASNTIVITALTEEVSGKIFASRVPRRKTLSPSWWHDLPSQSTQVIGVGTKSSLWYRQYSLADQALSFWGFAGAIRFYIGSRKGRRLAKRTAKSVGRILFDFSRRGVTESELEASIRAAYERQLFKIAESYDPKEGDSLNLLFLEEQLQGFEKAS